MTRAMWIAAILTFGSATAVGAQSIQVGLGSGATFSTLVGDHVVDPEYHTAPFFGSEFIYHPPGSVFGFETGVHWTSKGARTELEGAFVGGRGVLKLNYYEVPLLLRLEAPVGGPSLRPTFHVGGSVAFEKNCKKRGEPGIIDVEFDCSNELFDGALDTKAVEFGASVGASLDMALGTDLMFVPVVRYTRGLQTVMDAEDEDREVKNSSIMLGVQLRLIVGG